ncbi:NAD(P)H-dependent oxidoreductase [Rivibacter subsaxonicus]|uniref:Kef-type potassium/proton antiporter accessory protein (CPA2 family) n=1 Tax=Rivibacter subsaxonicus TaxID=457575 RepID=A0A4Q7VH41_9BURK|nr:NAD(P)H-dependent oxidoreductase [Rivibacter subsaxonicus]RZT95381.1 Kef-type potassium/proton antiporter accessory protein (CPA2 family) [Rivibacter subsaxonicus]
MADVLVLVAHPDLRASRANAQLLKAARAAGTQVPERIEVRDLYALYPDYVIDVAAEQRAAHNARLIVWQHPIHWYSMPPLMKLWLDEVLELGWAYGRGGTALAGRDVWLVTTTGGAEAAYHPRSYNRYFFDAFLPPYEQTAVLCGMRFLPPLVLHGAHKVGKDVLEAHVQRYREALLSYPDWPELADLEECPSCEVPVGDRPAMQEA